MRPSSLAARPRPLTAPGGLATGPSPLRVGAVVLVAALAFAGLRLVAIGGDVTSFVRAGDELTQPRAGAAAGLAVAEDSAGYDGQFSYRIARAPLSSAERVDGVGFDRPADRVGRIGYPALAWAASLGGQRALVPWALVGVNVVALGAIGALGAALARRAGRSGWWGLLPAAAPGLVVALSRDLTEVVAAAALLAAVVLLRPSPAAISSADGAPTTGETGVDAEPDRRRLALAAAVMVLAVLTRETTLVLPLALLGVGVLGHLPRLPARLDRVRRGLLGDRATVPLWVGAVPLAAFAGWRAYLATVWDAPGSYGADTPVNGLTVPLLEPLRQVVAFATSGDTVDLVQLVQLLLVLAGVALVGVAAWRAGAGVAHERVAVGLALVLLVSLSTWDRAVVFLRYPTDVLVLGAAVLPAVPALAGRAARAALPLLALTALLWIAVV